MQNPDISEKASRKCYSAKEYELPSGKIIYIQGYENYGLDKLINEEHIAEKEIITKRKKVPTIWYVYNGNTHRHYVDIYIKSQKRCIEIKSTWTFEKNKEQVFLKQKTAKNLGYKYEIWIFGQGGKIIEKYD